MNRTTLLEKLSGEGSFDSRVLTAIASVDRSLFVPPELQAAAWEDRALPIGWGQTISQPLIVAMMSQALQLEGWERVLEVGTGSGYQTAILSHLCREVYSVELLPELVAMARDRFQRLGIENVQLRCGDGAQGWPERAPFDATLVAAAPEEVPRPLFTQLAPGGCLVIPVGPPGGEQWLRSYRLLDSGELEASNLGPVKFVPLVAPEGTTR